ncbi:MAG: esterase [Bacteroidales bacterium]|nr:esterase [Bacteroidales bacterium]
MKKLLIGIVLFAGATFAATAQQANINLDWNPQKDTEGLVPFSSRLNSPIVHDNHTATFKVWAPEAESVAVSGAFLTVLHQRGPLAMTKGEDGVWSVTTPALPVDMYQYNIIIDGVSGADPNNHYAAFTAMPPYSELIIHGDGPQWYDAKDVPHGAVVRHVYYSKVTKGEREMYVYLPPKYNPKKKYPVLYLMGGSGEMPHNWIYNGRVNFIMDNLLAEKKAKEMIIAVINNQVVHRNHPKHADLTFDVMARELREVIIPFIDGTYKTIANPHGRAISGLSMGGRHTMFSGMERCLDLFANFGVLSAGDPKPEETMPKFFSDPNVNRKIDYLFVGQGTEEANNAFNVRVKGFVDALVSHNIAHEYYVGGHGGHDWSTWRHLLYFEFLPNLF